MCNMVGSKLVLLWSESWTRWLPDPCQPPLFCEFMIRWIGDAIFWVKFGLEWKTELASGRRCVACKAWPWERLEANSQLQLTLWPSHWVHLTCVFCFALSGDIWGYSVSSVTVSTTGFWNLDLACQIHLIHWKLRLNSAGSTQCITPHSSSQFIFLELSFYHLLWFMCMLWPKETGCLLCWKHLCIS